MRKVLTALGATLASLSLVGFGVPAQNTEVSPSPSDSPAPSESADSSGSETASESSLGAFGACLAGQAENPQGQMVLLLDQSTSLEQADPDGQRAVASKYLVDQLVEYAENSGAELDLQVAGFAADYDGQEWITLSAENRDTIHSQIDDIVNNLIPIDTDYVNAFAGARQSLAANKGDYPDACQSIAWFTDGSFYIDARTSPDQLEAYGSEKPYAPGASLQTVADAEAVRDQGAEELCRPQGTMDQVRAQGITVFGFALSSMENDWTLMQNAVEATDCGDITEPRGSFFEAGAADQLIMDFNEIAQPDNPPTTYENVPVCRNGVGCEEGFITFTLDDAISSLHVLAYSDDEEARPLFILPDGTEADAADDSFPFTVEEHSSRAVSVRLDRDSASQWPGAWRLAMVSDNTDGRHFSDISIRLKSSVGVQWPEELSQKARVGETLEGVQLRLVDQETGHEIDPTQLSGSLQVTAGLTDAAGQSYLVAAGGADSVTEPTTVDLTEAAPGPAVVNITTVITTAPATDHEGNRVPGTMLEPAHVQTSLVLQPPANFPSVSDPVTFTELDGTTEATATVEVTGPGCVWFDSEELKTAPQNIGAVSISSEHSSAENCVSVEEGQTADLPLTLTIGELDNGAINGDLTLQTAPADELTRTMPVTVSFSAEVLKPLDTGLTIVTTVIATLLGILIPVVLLYLAKMMAARIPQGSYRHFSTTVSRDHSGGMQLPPPSELATANHPGGSTLHLGNVQLKAKMSWSPFGQTWVTVANDPQVSVATQSLTHVKGRAKLPQTIANQWIVRKVSADQFEVIFILDGSFYTGVEETWHQTLTDANSYLSAAIEVLDELDPQETQPPYESGPTGFADGQQPPFGGPFGGPGGQQPGGGSPFGGGGGTPPPPPPPPSSYPGQSPFGGGPSA